MEMKDGRDVNVHTRNGWVQHSLTTTNPSSVFIYFMYLFYSLIWQREKERGSHISYMFRLPFAAGSVFSGKRSLAMVRTYITGIRT